MRRLSLPEGLAISLALHALVIAGGWGYVHWSPAPVSQQLVVEMFGMVANQQSAESQKSARQEARTEQKPVSEKRVEKKASRPQTAPSPVQVAQEAKQQQEVVASQPNKTPASDEQQRQQRLNVDPQLEALRSYLSQLKKIVRAKQVYPKEAKALWQVGTPVVSFLVKLNGEIDPASIVLKQSGGYPLLDASALAAVQAAAASTLPQPPRAMRLDIDLGYNPEKM